MSSPPEGQLEKFESAVQKLSARVGGVLFDPESVRASYFAPFYSAVHEAARTYFDRLGSTEAAEKHLETFRETPKGTAEELRRWMANRIEIRRGRGDILQAATETHASRNIGIVPLSRFLYSVALTVRAGTDPARRKPLPLFFERLDTRPTDLQEAAKVARSPLFNLPLAEKYARAATAAAPVTAQTLAVDLAWWSRDVADLRRIAGDASATVDSRSRALRALSHLENADPSYLRARYLEVMRAKPEDVRPLSDWVAWLEERGDLDGGRDAVRQWLAIRGGKQDLTAAAAVEIDARLLEKQGKLSEAWAIILPAIPTGKSGVLERAASILTAQKKFTEALAMARRNVDRYPEGEEGYAAVARIHWLLDQPADAAIVLARSHELNEARWADTSATVFGDVFSDRSDAKVESAFAALLEKQLPANGLANFAKAIGRKGNHALAFRFLSRLQGSGPETAAIRLSAYDEAKEHLGAEKALEWFRTSFMPGPQNAVVLFQYQRYELLWEVFVGGSPQKDDSIQVIRTAGVLQTPGKNDERRAELVSYFESRPRKGFAVYGLYLLGKADRKEVLRQFKEVNYATNVGWVLGLKAASEGHAEEASDWLQVSVETGLDKVPPHAWSWEMLSRWERKKKLFDRVDLLAPPDEPPPI